MHGSNIFCHLGLELKWHTGSGGEMGTLFKVHPDTLKRQGLFHLIKEQVSVQLS